MHNTAMIIPVEETIRFSDTANWSEIKEGRLAGTLRNDRKFYRDLKPGRAKAQVFSQEQQPLPIEITHNLQEKFGELSWIALALCGFWTRETAQEDFARHYGSPKNSTKTSAIIFLPQTTFAGLDWKSQVQLKNLQLEHAVQSRKLRRFFLPALAQAAAEEHIQPEEYILKLHRERIINEATAQKAIARPLFARHAQRLDGLSDALAAGPNNELWSNIVLAGIDIP